MALVTFSNKRRTFWRHLWISKIDSAKLCTLLRVSLVLFCCWQIVYFFSIWFASSVFIFSIRIIDADLTLTKELIQYSFIPTNPDYLPTSLSIISNILGDNHTLCFVKLAMSIFSSLLFQFCIARLYAIIINDALLYNGSFVFYPLTKWYVAKYIKYRMYLKTVLKKYII